MSSQYPFQMQLRESAARAVNGAFTSFLDREINISKAVRAKASVSQKHLREFLISERTRDSGFVRILQIVDNDFLGGSFARHSKLKPLDDIDIYFPVDGYGLIYSSYGRRLPYDVLSDGVLTENPLLTEGDRWMDGSSVSSRKLINGFARVLNRHYPAQTRVRRAGEAVNIQMTELGFDVVPCFSLKPDNYSEQPFYVIPDGANGWIHTNPRIDNEVSAELQRNNNKKFRNAVKLVKWWNKNRFSEQLTSYYVEFWAIMRGFQLKNQWGGYVELLSDAVALGFESLRDAVHLGDLASWLPSAPPVARGYLTAEQIQVVDAAASVARDAVNAELNGDSDTALTMWRLIFGPKFDE